jgi:chitin disaccharide deacetylase
MMVWQRRLLAFVVSCVLASALAVLSISVQRAPRYVIIHSDDAGMYSSVNAATIDAIEKGLVSSCSILVPCPAFDEFAKYAVEHPNRDFGIHLTLNCEKEEHRWGPVLARHSVPSLVDGEGMFWRTPAETAEHAKIDEAALELRAQIDKALAAGIQLTHLDHHMFVLFRRADFLELYVQLGKEYGLPIRYSKALPDRDDLDPNNTDLLNAYRDHLDRFTRMSRPLLEEIDTQNYNVAPEDKREYFLDLIPKIKPGVSEILIHCAYNQHGVPLAPHASRRQADTEVFSSLEMRDALIRGGIQVINWKQFHDMTANATFASSPGVK